jgi:hypothetical protein
MARNVTTPEVAIGGAVFRNSNTAATVTESSGAVFMRSPTGNTVTFTEAVESPTFPRGAEIFSNAIRAKCAGIFRSGTVVNDPGQELPFSYGVELARSATIFQSNKTSNYYSRAVDINNGNIAGSLMTTSSTTNIISPLAAVRYTGNIVATARNTFLVNEVFAYYFDTVNSRHVWMCNDLSASNYVRLVSTDGVSFTSQTIATTMPYSAMRFTLGNRSARPCIFTNGNNGLFVAKTTTTNGTNTETFGFLRTTDNFASQEDVTPLRGSSFDRPILLNYNGTTFCALLVDAGNPTINAVARYSTDFGATSIDSTITGATTTLFSPQGVGVGAGVSNNIAGASLATATGANASQFMYMGMNRNGRATAHSYYTSNGGQSFTSSNLTTQLNTIGPAGIEHFTSLNFHNGIWVALYSYNDLIYVLRSANNGSTWSNPTLLFTNAGTAALNTNLANVFSHNGTFVAVSAFGNNRRFFAKSTDGLTWTDLADPFFSMPYAGSFYETSDHFVVCGRVLSKSTLEIVDFFTSAATTASGVIAAHCATPQLTVASQHQGFGTSVINANVISQRIYTTETPRQANTYATSGSVFGAFQYNRVG